MKCVLNPASTLADSSRWAKSELELFPMVQELQQVIKEGAANPVQAKLLMDSIKSSVLTSFYTDTRVTDTIASSFVDNGIRFETFWILRSVWVLLSTHSGKCRGKILF